MLKFLQNITRSKEKPNMIWLVAKYLGYCCAAFVSLFILLGTLAYYWLSDNQPKNLDWVKYSFEYGDFTLTTDNTVITYSGHGNIKVNVSLKIIGHRSKTEVMHATDMQISFDVAPLLSLKPVSTDIEISGMNINLDNLQINSGINPVTSSFEMLEDFIDTFSEVGFLYIKKFDISNSSITKDKTIYVLEQNSSHTLDTSRIITKISYGKEQSNIELSILKRNLEVKVSNLPISILASITPVEYRIPTLYNAEKDFKCDLALSYNSDSSRFSIKSIAQDKSNKNIVSELIFEADNESARDVFNIGKFFIKLTGQGVIKANGSLDLSKMNIDLDIDMQKFKMDNTVQIWPLGVQVDVRKWIVSSISEGVIDEGHLKIRIDGLSNIGPDSLKGFLKYQNLTINYYQEYEKITKVQGTANISLNSIVFKSSSAEILSSKIDEVEVGIFYGEPESPVKIHGIVTQGNVKDFIHFIGKETIEEFNKKHVKIQEASGKLKAEVSLSFPLTKVIALENMDLNIAGHIQNLEMQMLDFIKAKDGDLDIRITNKIVSLIGKAKINNQLSRVEWSSNLVESEQFSNRLVVNTIVGPSAEFKKLLADKIHIDEGEAFANFVYVDHLGLSAILVQLDLKDAKFAIPDIGMIKEKGQNSSLNVELSQDGITGNWRSKKLSLTSDLVNINADLELGPSLNLIQMNSKVFYENTELHVHVASSPEKLDIKVHGPKLSLAKVNLLNLFNVGGYQALLDSQKDSKQPEENKQKISLSVQIDDLVMKNNVKFSNIIGNFECYKRLCSNSGLSFSINETEKVRIKLDSSNNQNLWNISGTNASLFLKGFNIYTDIEDGVFESEIHTVPKKLISSSSGSVVSGKMKINNFYAVKTNLIGNILFASPIAAISSMFQHKQFMYFETLEANFIFSFIDNTLRINRGFAIGNIFSITSQGYIKVKENKLFLKGVLSPNSAANALLNSSISMSYLISGKPSDPTIEVSPLASTIVGFLSKF